MTAGSPFQYATADAWLWMGVIVAAVLVCCLVGASLTAYAMRRKTPEHTTYHYGKKRP